MPNKFQEAMYFHRKCGRKKQYANKALARDAREKTGDLTLEIYHCPICGKYHMGHDNKRTDHERGTDSG